MARQFGIVTNISGLSAGIMVNSLDGNDTVEIAEARDESGKVSDLKAYSKGSTLSCQGLVDSSKGNLVEAGSIITIGSKQYLIDSVQKREVNTEWVEATISCRTADNATLAPLQEASNSNAQ